MRVFCVPQFWSDLVLFSHPLDSHSIVVWALSTLSRSLSFTHLLSHPLSSLRSPILPFFVASQKYSKIEIRLTVLFVHWRRIRISAVGNKTEHDLQWMIIIGVLRSTAFFVAFWWLWSYFGRSKTAKIPYGGGLFSSPWNHLYMCGFQLKQSFCRVFRM